MTLRIYHVEMYPNDTGSIDHLVEAKSPAAATAHVIRKYGKVALASQRVIAHLVRSGYAVEETGREEAAPAE